MSNNHHKVCGCAAYLDRLVNDLEAGKDISFICIVFDESNPDRAGKVLNFTHKIGRRRMVAAASSLLKKIDDEKWRGEDESPLH